MKSKNVYLAIFIIGLFLTFNITNFMLKLGFSTTTGIMESSDKRFVYSLISLFGLIGFFIEIVFEKLNTKSLEKINEEPNSNE